MKKLLREIIISLFCFMGFIASAQDVHVADSVFSTLKKLNNEDKVERIIQLLDKRLFTFSVDLNLINRALVITKNEKLQDQHFELLLRKAVTLRKSGKEKDALKILRSASATIKKGDLKSKAALLNAYGSYYYGLNMPDSSLKYLNKSLELSRPADDTANLFVSYHTLGKIYNDAGNFKKSLSYSKAAEKLISQNTKSEYAFNIYTNMGISYAQTGNNKKAIEYYMRSLESAQINDFKIIAYINLGTLFHLTNDFHKAIAYFLKANQLLAPTDRDNFKATCLINLGSSYRAIEKYDSSLYFAHKADALIKKLSIHKHYATNLNLMGMCHYMLDNLDSSLWYHKKAMKIYLENGDSLKVASVLSDIGNTYSDMKRYDEAISCFNRAMKILESFDDPYLLSQINLNFSVIYQRLGNFELAYKYYVKYNESYDTLINQQYKRDIQDLVIEHEAGQKEKENTILRQNQKVTDAQLARQKGLKTIFFLIVLLVLIAGGFAYTFFRNRLRMMKINQELVNNQIALLNQEIKLTELQKAKADEHAEMLKKELEARKNEIERISAMVVKNSELVQDLLGKLSSLRPYCNQEGRRLIISAQADYTNFSVDHNWEIFKNNFSELHPDFYYNLEKKHPDLTSNEKQLVAFILMGLKTKEIASITFQSVNSINVAKNRLKTRFELEAVEDLQNYLSQF